MTKQVGESMTTEKKKHAHKRKWWFRFMKKVSHLLFKRPEFIYLGEERFDEGCIILSNHEGTDAPMSWELYCDEPIRMWGAHEMNSGLIKMYKYQSRVYFHEKKGWSLFGARMYCLIASPLTNLYYKGLNLISTYADGRFLKTLRESIETLQAGTNVVIYPEISDNGYLAELEGFHKGCVALMELCHKKGMNTPIFVTYFRKSDMKYIIDKPVYYKDLAANGATKDEIAKKLLDRCNELGKMQFTDETEKAVETEVAPAQA